MNEKDALFDMEQELKNIELPVPETRDFEKELERAIDRRIRKICLKTILTVAIVAAVVFLGVSPVMGLICPTPREIQRGSGISLEEYLGAYYENMKPYVEVIPFSSDEERRHFTTNRGFGRYTVSLNVLDLSDEEKRIADGNVKVGLKWGSYSVESDPEGKTGTVLNQFNYRGTVEDVRTAVEGIPASSRVYLSVRAAEPVALETIRSYGVEPRWIEVYNDSSEWRGGVLLWNSTSETGDDWRQSMDDEELRQVYLANLDTLLAVPRMLNDLRIGKEVEEEPAGLETEYAFGGGVKYWGRVPDMVEQIEAARDAVAAQEGPLMTERYCVEGSRDEVLAFLERADIKRVGVDNMYMNDRVW